MARSEKPSTEKPAYDPTPTPEVWNELHEMAYEVEQTLADVIALSKVASSGLSDSIEIFDGQGQHSMFDAKRSIMAITRLLQTLYNEYGYPLSVQIGGIISDMEMEHDTEPTSDGGDHE